MNQNLGVGLLVDILTTLVVVAVVSYFSDEITPFLEMLEGVRQ